MLTSAIVLFFGLMLAAYWWIPEHGPGLRYAAEGAAVGAVLMVVLAQGFPLYIELTGGYSLYGSLFAFILLLLFWLYLVGQIFVIGAEVAAIRSGCRHEPVKQPGAPVQLTDRDGVSVASEPAE